MSEEKLSNRIQVLRMEVFHKDVFDEFVKEIATLEAKYDHEFETFNQAMIAEMQRHSAEFGDSWKNKTFMVDVERSAGERAFRKRDMLKDSLIPQLRNKFQTILDEPNIINENPSDLVDIANFCAMIWIHKKGLLVSI